MERSVYLFDFDGVLVDSMPYWSGTMLDVLKKNKIAYPDNIISIITPLGNEGAVTYFRDNLGAKMSVEEMLAQVEEYAFPKYRDEIILKPGVHEYLDMLRKKGCSVNILTASPHKMVHPCLKRNGVFELFDNIWSCEDFGLPKSNPEIYFQAAQKLGVQSADVVFFDDNINAVKTAVQAGMFTVGVYDKTSENFSETIKNTANMYITGFSDLIK